MDSSIVFTPAQILAFCAGIVTISGAVNIVVNLILNVIHKAKQPNLIQDERIADLEKRVARHDDLLARDQRRIEALEDGTRVTQRAILALLSHGLDGNNIEEMKKAKHELEDYLIGRN